MIWWRISFRNQIIMLPPLPVLQLMLLPLLLLLGGSGGLSKKGKNPYNPHSNLGYPSYSMTLQVRGSIGSTSACPFLATGLMPQPGIPTPPPYQEAKYNLHKENRLKNPKREPQEHNRNTIGMCVQGSLYFPYIYEIFLLYS